MICRLLLPLLLVFAVPDPFRNLPRGSPLSQITAEQIQAWNEAARAERDRKFRWDHDAAEDPATSIYITAKNAVATLLTHADGVANGTTTFTSAAGTFTGLAGRTIVITGRGRYTIAAVGSAHSITLSGSPAAGTGLTYSVVYDLPQFAVSRVTAPLITYDENASEALENRAAVKIDLPGAASDQDVIAILDEPLINGAIGRAVISGITWVKVQVGALETAWKWADVTSGNPAHLVMSESCAPVRVLWKQSGTGEKWALVHLRGPSCDGGLTACPGATMTGYDEDAEMLVATIDPATGCWVLVEPEECGDTTPPNSFTTMAVSGQSDIVASDPDDTLTFVNGSGTTITTNAGLKAITIANSQPSFGTIAVAGQSNVVADQLNDTLTVIAGTNITLATSAGGDSLTITGPTLPNTFSTISVSGQSDVVADSSADTLTFVAGANVTITTSAGGDSITLAAATGGDMFGTTSSTDNALIRWDGTDGKHAQNSTVTLTDQGVMTLSVGAASPVLIVEATGLDGTIVQSFRNASGDQGWITNSGSAVMLGGILTSNINATTLRTTASNGDQLKLMARDVDGGTYTEFITLTAANSPTCVLTNVQLVTSELGRPVSGDLELCNNLSLATGVQDNLPVTNLNSGTNASSASAWFGDATWKDVVAFKTISVSGQSDVVADQLADALTLVAGTNITLTTSAGGDSVTITAAGGGGASNTFTTISVSGQSDVIADTSTDTLTFVAGTGMTIVTDPSTDTITFGNQQACFGTVSVSGQSDVVADAANDVLTLVAGANITLTTSAGGDSVTITAAGGGGASNSFTTISVSGQSDVIADSSTDTLTLIAGTNITLTTSAGGDSITIAGPTLQPAFGVISVSGQSDVVADSTTDGLTLIGGTNITITTNAGADSVTIAGPTLPLAFGTFSVSGQSDVVADTSADTLTMIAGTGITLTTSGGGDSITITNTVTAPNSFSTISVSGQSDVVADSTADTLTLVAGANITLTTSAGGDSVTITASGGGSASNSFTTISVSGQSDVIADSSTDTLTIVSGTNVTIATNAGADSITISSAQSTFSTISVLGQSDVVADSATDVLTFVAGANITITTSPSTDEITITAAGGGSASNSFTTISVSGQSDVIADSATDTLTIVNGTNIAVTTNAGADSLTIALSGQVAVPNGGTGDSSFTANAPIFGGTTSTSALQSGTAGSLHQILMSNGSSAIGTYENVYDVLVAVSSFRVSGSEQVLAASASNTLEWLDVGVCPP